MKRFFLTLLFLVGGGLLRADQPNIIIYMVDDLGWNHISASQVTMGTHGKQYRTPQLERLAEEGLSFTTCLRPAELCPDPCRDAVRSIPGPDSQ